MIDSDFQALVDYANLTLTQRLASLFFGEVETLGCEQALRLAELAVNTLAAPSPPSSELLGMCERFQARIMELGLSPSIKDEVSEMCRVALYQRGHASGLAQGEAERAELQERLTCAESCCAENIAQRNDADARANISEELVEIVGAALLQTGPVYLSTDGIDRHCRWFPHDETAHGAVRAFVLASKKV